MIGPMPDFWGPVEVVLGTSFLKKVYSVFDWDEKTISCEFLHPPWDSRLIQDISWETAELRPQGNAWPRLIIERIEESPCIVVIVPLCFRYSFEQKSSIIKFTRASLQSRIQEPLFTSTITIAIE
jgi:hypothetical protein